MPVPRVWENTRISCSRPVKLTLSGIAFAISKFFLFFSGSCQNTSQWRTPFWMKWWDFMTQVGLWSFAEAQSRTKMIKRLNMKKFPDWTLMALNHQIFPPTDLQLRWVVLKNHAFEWGWIQIPSLFPNYWILNNASSALDFRKEKCGHHAHFLQICQRKKKQINMNTRYESIVFSWWKLLYFI